MIDKGSQPIVASVFRWGRWMPFQDSHRFQAANCMFDFKIRSQRDKINQILHHCMYGLLWCSYKGTNYIPLNKEKKTDKTN